jgi:hypothetical protein
MHGGKLDATASSDSGIGQGEKGRAVEDSDTKEQLADAEKQKREERRVWQRAQKVTEVILI